jgi:hypothetical protein
MQKEKACFQVIPNWPAKPDGVHRKKARGAVIRRQIRQFRSLIIQV